MVIHEVISDLVFLLLRRRLLLLPDLPLPDSGQMLVMVARSKDSTTTLGGRLHYGHMIRPELHVVLDPRETAKIESEIGMTGVNPKEDNRLKNPSDLVSDWDHSSNLYDNIFKKSKRNVHFWLTSSLKWRPS